MLAALVVGSSSSSSSCSSSASGRGSRRRKIGSSSVAVLNCGIIGPKQILPSTLLHLLCRHSSQDSSKSQSFVASVNQAYKNLAKAHVRAHMSSPRTQNSQTKDCACISGSCYC